MISIVPQSVQFVLTPVICSFLLHYWLSGSGQGQPAVSWYMYLPRGIPGAPVYLHSATAMARDLWAFATSSFEQHLLHLFLSLTSLYKDSMMPKMCYSGRLKFVPMGNPLAEIRGYLPILAKGCRKIRDAELLDSIRYIMEALQPDNHQVHVPLAFPCGSPMALIMISPEPRQWDVWGMERFVLLITSAGSTTWSQRGRRTL